MIQFPAVRFKKIPGYVSLKLPLESDGMAQAFFEGLKAGYVQATFKKPEKPRTTGEHSQNTHINGHCQQISEITGAEFTAVKEFMKRLCVEQGRAWKFKTLPDGTICPGSESNATTEEAAALIETIHQWAAEWDIRLIENDDERVSTNA